MHEIDFGYVNTRYGYVVWHLSAKKRGGIAQCSLLKTTRYLNSFVMEPSGTCLDTVSTARVSPLQGRGIPLSLAGTLLVSLQPRVMSSHASRVLPHRPPARLRSAWPQNSDPTLSSRGNACGEDEPVGRLSVRGFPNPSQHVFPAVSY